MAIIVAILLVVVVYLVYQIHALKTSNAKGKSDNKATRNTAKADVIYEQPDNIPGKADNEMNYEELDNYDATYTALDRTRNGDDDHSYSHLNEMQQKETGI